MRKLGLVLMATLSTAFVADPAEPEPQARGKEVLSKWIGSWESDIVIKPAAWTLRGGEVSGATETEWILHDQFQQMSGSLGEHETLEIQRFDRRSNRFHKWTFNSDGATSFWTGNWSEESSTMTWTYVDFGLGLGGETSDRFIGGGKYESTMVLRDGTGNTLMDIRSKHRRSSP